MQFSIEHFASGYEVQTLYVWNKFIAGKSFLPRRGYRWISTKHKRLFRSNSIAFTFAISLIVPKKEEIITGDVETRFDTFLRHWPEFACCAKLLYFEVPEVPIKLCSTCVCAQRDKIYNYIRGVIHANVLGRDECPFFCDLCGKHLMLYSNIRYCYECCFSLATCFARMNKEQFLIYLASPKDARKVFRDERELRVMMWLLLFNTFNYLIYYLIHVSIISFLIRISFMYNSGKHVTLF